MTAIITPITQPFASTRSDNYLPTTTSSPILVSQPDGFPLYQRLNPTDPNFTPVTEEQMNGTFNYYTDLLFQQGQGKQYTFDATLSTKIGGYPQGSILYCASNNTYQRSLINNNTANFVATPSYINDGVNWINAIQPYMPDIIDDISTGNVTIGGRIPSGSFTTSTKSTTTGILVSFFSHVVAFIPSIGFYATGTDGITVNSGIQCTSGSRPSVIGNLTTLGASTTSIAVRGDLNNIFNTGYSINTRPIAQFNGSGMATLADIPAVPFIPTVYIQVFNGSGGFTTAIITTLPSGLKAVSMVGQLSVNPIGNVLLSSFGLNIVQQTSLGVAHATSAGSAGASCAATAGQGAISVGLSSGAATVGFAINFISN